MCVYIYIYIYISEIKNSFHVLNITVNTTEERNVDENVYKQK